jgi:aspartate 1-decarboxylase
MELDRHMLKSKIHRARVTEACVDYEGSLTIDEALMDAADILPYERVQVLSVDSGARLETYAIPGERDSGVICVNGAAAQVIHAGELAIILSYAWMTDDEARAWQPNVIRVDEGNRRL